MSSRFMEMSDGSDDESQKKNNSINFNSTLNLSDEDQDSESDDERALNTLVLKLKKNKRSHFDAFEESDDDEEEEVEDGDDKNSKEKNTTLKEKSSVQNNDKLEEESYSMLNQKSSLYGDQNLTNLSKDKLLKIEKKLKKTGVVYISKIPPYMKPTKMRQILGRFGKVDRIFLKPETKIQYSKRVKYGGNKKRMYVEGWAEFMNKKDGKLCVDTMNGQKIGGKKGSFYYDDILNLKYLKSFKWMDLTSQMAKENEARQSKLMMEISNATKLNKEFIKNVEKSKMIENIQKKKQKRAQEAAGENKEDD